MNIKHKFTSLVIYFRDDEATTFSSELPFLLSISVFVFSFFITLFCLVPCGRLSWLLVSFWAHVNIVYAKLLTDEQTMTKTPSLAEAMKMNKLVSENVHIVTTLLRRESDVTIRNISQSLLHSWHRYGMKKLCHCHPMHSQHCSCWIP